VSSQPDSLPADYPRSLERELAALLAAGADRSTDVRSLLAVADVYFNLGDDLLTDPDRQRAAFEEGARLARRAIEIDDGSAEAHFLYAINLGSAVRLRSRAVGALKLHEIKRHAARALEIDPGCARALQFMGALLAELPAPFGGDAREAERLLERAVAIDGNFTNARIHLARLYLRRGRVEAARQQLEAVVRAERPHYPWTWARRFRPEAERLLATLPRGAAP
jgi:tetratricopeptide (TPR) repeat protein